MDTDKMKSFYEVALAHKSGRALEGPFAAQVDLTAFCVWCFTEKPLVNSFWVKSLDLSLIHAIAVVAGSEETFNDWLIEYQLCK